MKENEAGLFFIMLVVTLGLWECPWQGILLWRVWITAIRHKHHCSLGLVLV